MCGWNGSRSLSLRIGTGIHELSRTALLGVETGIRESFEDRPAQTNRHWRLGLEVASLSRTVLLIFGTATCGLFEICPLPGCGSTSCSCVGFIDLSCAEVFSFSADSGSRCQDSQLGSGRNVLRAAVQYLELMFRQIQLSKLARGGCLPGLGYWKAGAGPDVWRSSALQHPRLLRAYSCVPSGETAH